MINMDVSIVGFLTRLDMALMAIISIVVLQTMCVMVASLIKIKIAPMPIFEMVCRSAIIGLSDRLNRADRTDFALIFRGIIVFFVIFSFIFVILIICQLLGVFLQPFWSFLPIILFISPIFGLKSVYMASQGDDYKNLAIGLNQNLIPTDDHGMRREGAKLLSLALTDWFLYPLIIFIVLGWPFLMIFVALSTFIRLSASPQTLFVGIFEKLYIGITMILNIVIAPILFLASLFSLGANPMQLLKAIKYPRNMVLAAFAYGQGVVLGGAFQNRHGDKIKQNWIGNDGATAKLDHKATIRFMIFHTTCVFLTTALLFVTSIYL